MKSISSYLELKENLAANEQSALLLFHPGKESSICALRNVEEAKRLNKTHTILLADVSQIRDIHQVYGITSTPSLLLFKKGEMTRVIKGCHEHTILDALLYEGPAATATGGEAPKVKRVTVYSTQTCSWCNTLKSWLRKNKIQFTNIDVAQNEKAAQDMVRRSGQQGVPQTDINGHLVVGFDQKRLKELLEIQ